MSANENETELERANARADHWKNCHDGQVASKRRLSIRYGDAVRAVIGLYGELREVEKQQMDEGLLLLVSHTLPEGQRDYQAQAALERARTTEQAP
jgi:hypothetical protein